MKLNAFSIYAGTFKKGTVKGYGKNQIRAICKTAIFLTPIKRLDHR